MKWDFRWWEGAKYLVSVSVPSEILKNSVHFFNFSYSILLEILRYGERFHGVERQGVCH